MISSCTKNWRWGGSSWADGPHGGGCPPGPWDPRGPWGPLAQLDPPHFQFFAQLEMSAIGNESSVNRTFPPRTPKPYFPGPVFLSCIVLCSMAWSHLQSMHKAWCLAPSLERLDSWLLEHSLATTCQKQQCPSLPSSPQPPSAYVLPPLGVRSRSNGIGLDPWSSSFGSRAGPPPPHPPSPPPPWRGRRAPRATLGRAWLNYLSQCSRGPSKQVGHVFKFI